MGLSESVSATSSRSASTTTFAAGHPSSAGTLFIASVTASSAFTFNTSTSVVQPPKGSAIDVPKTRIVMPIQLPSDHVNKTPHRLTTPSCHQGNHVVGPSYCSGTLLLSNGLLDYLLTVTMTVTRIVGTTTLAIGAPTPCPVYMSAPPYCTTVVTSNQDVFPLISGTVTRFDGQQSLTLRPAAGPDTIVLSSSSEATSTVLVTKKTPVIVYTPLSVGQIFGPSTTAEMPETTSMQHVVFGSSGLLFTGTTVALPSIVTESTQDVRVVTTDFMIFNVDPTDVVLQSKTYAIGLGATPTTLSLAGETISLGSGGIGLPHITIMPKFTSSASQSGSVPLASSVALSSGGLGSPRAAAPHVHGFSVSVLGVLSGIVAGVALM